MKKLSTILVVLIAMFMLASAVAAKGNSERVRDDLDKFHDPEKVDWALKKVRAATAKYHSVEKAIKDGYTPTPDFIGNMGYHYVNPALVADGKIDPLKPEVMLYAPDKNGNLKLVAVEYLSIAETGNSLFGRNYDPAIIHPVTGEVIVPPSLHAWIWEKNPDGVFAQFNPRIGHTAH